MYSLTLSYAERQAMDWVGYRYAHGDDLARLLIGQSEWGSPDNPDWSCEGPLTFSIPEHVAWAIREIGEGCEYRWDCFAPALAEKLTDFCLSIV